MDSQLHIGMPGASLLHNVRQGLFQTVALHILEGSSSWLCSTDLEQGHHRERDLRGEEKKHCHGERMTKPRRMGSDRFLHLEQSDPLKLLVEYFSEMAH